MMAIGLAAPVEDGKAAATQNPRRTLLTDGGTRKKIHEKRGQHHRASSSQVSSELAVSGWLQIVCGPSQLANMGGSSAAEAPARRKAFS